MSLLNAECKKGDLIYFDYRGDKAIGRILSVGIRWSRIQWIWDSDPYYDNIGPEDYHNSDDFLVILEHCTKITEQERLAIILKDGK